MKKVLIVLLVALVVIQFFQIDKTNPETDINQDFLKIHEFGTYTAKKQAHKLEECGEMIEKGEMPLSSYTIIHKEAVLTEAQQAELIAYFKEIEKKINSGVTIKE